MCVLACYDLSSPQTNNRPFHFGCDERKGRKRMIVCQREEKENIREWKEKKKREEKEGKWEKKRKGSERRTSHVIHPTLIVCFNTMKRKKEEKEKRKKNE